MQTKAVIFGIKEFRLTKQEKFFFKKNKPWGIILFSRNINSIDQLKLLTTEIKHLFRDKKFPILIDEEGGKISRLGNIIDFSLFSQKNLNHLYKRNKKLFFNIYKTYINTVCGIFKYTGININTTPVLDVMRKKSHSVIGSRSFSSKVENVIKLGNICIELYKKNNIATVIKHIPGHGLSRSDSHHKMPTINADKKILNKIDFKAFRSCNSLFAMTCHAIYSKYDNKNTATHSRKVINDVIRKNIRFKGILITDDISMKSLKYNLQKNAIMALSAGCNLVLHCNGNLNEMYKLAKVIPKVDEFTKKKTSQFYKFLI